MYHTILLTLDGSLFSEHALPAALETARRADATLHVVHVYVPDEPWRDFEELTPYRFEGEPEYDGVYEGAERHLARRYLAWVARLAEERGVRARSALLDGEVAGAIERYAGDVEPDLVVIATHGRGALRRAWLGSVADTLVRELGRPALLVRPSEAGRPDPDAPPAFSHVLVPLDGSDEAEQVLRPAADLGALWDARYTLLTVIPQAVPLSPVSPTPVFGARGERAAQRAGPADRYLGRVAEELRRGGRDVQTLVVVDTNIAGAILANEDQLGADVVAVATHGRSGLSRLVMGSVAGELVRDAATPVLVYRPGPHASPAE